MGPIFANISERAAFGFNSAESLGDKMCFTLLELLQQTLFVS